jgi:sulfate/thiosulfate transport system permease protein
MLAKYGLRTLAIVYLVALLLAPIALIAMRAFEDGLAPVWDSLTSPAGLAALKLTLIAAAIAVPVNAVFGVIAALILAKPRLPGRQVMSLLIDLPLALSPVVVGLALVLVWGRNGWFGGWLNEQGIQVIFATPGIVIATILVSLPFVAREVLPVLREIGEEQQEAATVLGASPLQTFVRVTLPAIRYGLAYGVVLTTARALGEYGAVAVVSGKIAGRTETLTLRVEERFQAFDLIGAYAASVLLAFIALTIVVVMRLINRGEEY